MYGKNPNHANKFRRIFNKKYRPGIFRAVYSPISTGCGGCSGRAPVPALRPGRKNRHGNVGRRSGSVSKTFRDRFGDASVCGGTVRQPFGSSSGALWATVGGRPMNRSCPLRATVRERLKNVSGPVWGCCGLRRDCSAPVRQQVGSSPAEVRGASGNGRWADHEQPVSGSGILRFGVRTRTGLLRAAVT